MRKQEDKLVGLYLSVYNEENQGAVTMFRDHDCRDYSASFEAHVNEDEVAWYNHEYLEGIGIGKVSSVMVPYGYSLEMYEDRGFRKDKGVYELVGPA